MIYALDKDWRNNEIVKALSSLRLWVTFKSDEDITTIFRTVRKICDDVEYKSTMDDDQLLGILRPIKSIFDDKDMILKEIFNR